MDSDYGVRARDAGRSIRACPRRRAGTRRRWNHAGLPVHGRPEDPIRADPSARERAVGVTGKPAEPRTGACRGLPVTHLQLIGVGLVRIRIGHVWVRVVRVRVVWGGVVWVRVVWVRVVRGGLTADDLHAGTANEVKADATQDPCHISSKAFSSAETGRRRARLRDPDIRDERAGGHRAERRGGLERRLGSEQPASLSGRPGTAPAYGVSGRAVARSRSGVVRTRAARPKGRCRSQVVRRAWQRSSF
jgi:hypothetical protein